MLRGFALFIRRPSWAIHGSVTCFHAFEFLHCLHFHDEKTTAECWHRRIFASVGGIQVKVTMNLTYKSTETPSTWQRCKSPINYFKRVVASRMHLVQLRHSVVVCLVLCRSDNLFSDPFLCLSIDRTIDKMNSGYESISINLTYINCTKINYCRLESKRFARRWHLANMRFEKWFVPCAERKNCTEICNISKH